MTEELKPCPNPWCERNDPVVERTLRYMGDDSPRRVECDCGIHGPAKPTDADAITAWNTRLSHSAEKEALIEALEKIVEGDVPRPIAKPWRADWQYSKLDQCEHGLAMHDDCGRCIENFARSILLSMRNNGNG